MQQHVRSYLDHVTNNKPVSVWDYKLRANIWFRTSKFLGYLEYVMYACANCAKNRALFFSPLVVCSCLLRSHSAAPVLFSLALGCTRLSLPLKSADQSATQAKFIYAEAILGCCFKQIILLNNLSNTVAVSLQEQALYLYQVCITIDTT